MQNFKIRELSPAASRERLSRDYGSLVDIFQRAVLSLFYLLCMFLVLSVVHAQTTSHSTLALPIQPRDTDTPQNCTGEPQPLGAGPVPSPDDPIAFLTSSNFTSIAHSATPPPGFTAAYTHLNAAVTGDGYIAYEALSVYNPSICATSCKAIPDCVAFDIFFERAPAIALTPECTNPPSTTFIKCSYWRSFNTSSTVFNSGQRREAFDVVIAGSNIYTATLESPNPQNNAMLSLPDTRYVLAMAMLTGTFILGGFRVGDSRVVK